MVDHRSEETGDLCVKSLAIISDSRDHTTTVAVATFQAEALKGLKHKFLDVRKIHYFSDGASAHYKNKKIFINLSYHKNDFNLSAEQNFLTSHGKSAGDGVGDIIKRLAARASIQRPNQGQILNPHQLLTWVEKDIKGISLLRAPEEMVEEKNNCNSQEGLSGQFLLKVHPPFTTLHHKCWQQPMLGRRLTLPPIPSKWQRTHVSNNNENCSLLDAPKPDRQPISYYMCITCTNAALRNLFGSTNN